MADGRFFDASYYNECTQFRGSKERWFCNTVPDEQPNNYQIQEVPVQQETSTMFTDVTIMDSLHEPIDGAMEGLQSSGGSECDDSEEDPDFIPDTPEEEWDDKSEYDTHEQNYVSHEEEHVQLTCNPEDEPKNPEEKDRNSQQIIKHDEKAEFCRKGKKGKDYCFFCEELVLNFSRHVQRNHASEIEVHRIMALKPGCSQRKSLLTQLRKKGNYLYSQTIRKPVRKSYLENTELLPCTNCLGFYSAKQLWRHNKKCHGRTANAKAESQNFLLNLRVDKELREKVFPRMRADEISLKAKKDVLICAFATRYIKVHRERHFINVASRKMRELSRLLIEVQKCDNSVKNLFDALNPTKFDTLVSATKIVAKYDSVNDYYKSPSYALQMGTTLKQCCEIAISFALKRKELYANVSTACAEGELRTMIQLIEAHWRFEISTQAANDLNVKKWNKVTIVPLASDLKILRSYLIEMGNQVADKFLKNSSNRTLYIKLIEIVFCKVLILNRRRPGELQRLPVHLYSSNAQPNTYEEFSEIISPSEKVLMSNFKRIIIKGKRSRGVPVLFSLDVQKEIEILLKHRDAFFSTPNMYLFGNPGTSEPIAGYKILKKHVAASNVKNPNALTATKLRKHLATLCQIFSMTDNDVEQLSNFMGHSVGIHRQNYRLPDDVYQCSKLTKLLLLMENGEAAQFKGKSLDEININLDDDLLAEQENLEDITELNENEVENIYVGNKGEVDKPNEINRNRTANKRKRILTPWTSEEKKVVLTFFAKHVTNKKAPKKEECDGLIAKYPEILSNKSWLKIKVFVQNTYTKKKK